MWGFTTEGTENTEKASVATIELRDQEAIVLVDFLIRFRDKEEIVFEHKAEPQILFDLCAMLENQVPELLQADYGAKLKFAREAVVHPDYE